MIVARCHAGVDARRLSGELDGRLGHIGGVVIHLAGEIAKETRHLDQAVVLYLEADKAVWLIEIIGS